MQYIIFQYSWGPALIQRILIGFEAILEIVFPLPVMVAEDHSPICSSGLACDYLLSPTKKLLFKMYFYVKHKQNCRFAVGEVMGSSQDPTASC